MNYNDKNYYFKTNIIEIIEKNRNSEKRRYIKVISQDT